VRRNICLLAVLAIVASGCTPTRYRESADEDTYQIIQQKQEEVFGEAEADFTIKKQPLPEFMRGADGEGEPQPRPADAPVSLELSEETLSLLDEEKGELATLQKILSSEITDERIAALDDIELTVLLKLSYNELAELIIPTPPNAVKLTLAQTLELAVASSRQFQQQKERLFLSALGLTLQRHLWRPQLGLTGSATGKKEGEEKSIGAEGRFSLGQLLSSGGQLALNLGTNFAEFFTGDRRRAISSLLSFTFTQSLLRGGGRLVATENLTQGERNAVYAVRDFTRFRREFSVQVAQSYYQVLENRDNLINNFSNYITLRKNVIRSNEMLIQEHANVTSLDVDEARQDELEASNAWIFALQDYLDALDAFKITPLGLATDAPIVLDEKELQILTEKAEAGLPPPRVSPEEAVSRALASRLDLLSAEDALEDSERAVALARDALRAGLDISISSSADTEPETKALKFRFNESPYTAGLSLDLPVDRKQERNAYRQALIALESQKRSLSLQRDNIILDVRQTYRAVVRARNSVQIDRTSVDLAARRVDNTRTRLEAARAETRDVLLATRSLLTTKNQLTRALVAHEMARLELWLSTEELRVDEKGMWAEVEQPARGDEDVEARERSEAEEKELAES